MLGPLVVLLEQDGTHEADDCGLVLSVIAGYDSRDHDSLPHGLAEFAYSASSDPQFRIGKVTNARPRLPAGFEIAVGDALAVIESTEATISDAEFPDGPYEQAAELTILMEAAASFHELIHSGRCAELAHVCHNGKHALDDPLARINGYASLEFSANDYLQLD